MILTIKYFFINLYYKVFDYLEDKSLARTRDQVHPDLLQQLHEEGFSSGWGVGHRAGREEERKHPSKRLS